LKRRSVPFQLVIAGDGPERPTLATLATELGLNGSVKFTGDVPSARAFYEGVDVLAVPSVIRKDYRRRSSKRWRWDCRSWPQTSAEPIEAIVDGVTGHLVPAGSPDALSDALASDAKDREMLRAMGVKGRARVEQAFTTNTLIDAHMTAFSDLVSPPLVNEGAWYSICPP
jgi:phosphatidylinositol alpha-1,6-mannosyltransferase